MVRLISILVLTLLPFFSVAQTEVKKGVIPVVFSQLKAMHQ
jgi:hypothetical protein